jgi:adenylate cyclase
MRTPRSLFELSGRRIGLLVTLFFAVTYFASPDLLDLLEMKTLDLRFKARGAKDAGERVVIVAIDEKSINELGRWPWPRTRIAELVKTVSGGGAKAIGFDILFSEPDQNSGLQVVRSLREKAEGLKLNRGFLAFVDSMERGLDTDSRLSEEIKDSGRTVLGYFFLLDGESRVEERSKGRYSYVRSLGKGASSFQPLLWRSFYSLTDSSLSRRAYGSMPPIPS